MREYLELGTKAPDFEATDQNGDKIKLSDFKGKKVALYFYPKDDTPGCTKQACNLRDNYQELLDKNIQVIGVSKDSVESHQKFITKYELPFPLVVDEDLEITKQYKAYGEKNMYGKISMGVYRITYLIDEDGTIIGLVKRVKTTEHNEQLLNLLEKHESKK